MRHARRLRHCGIVLPGLLSLLAPAAEPLAAPVLRVEVRAREMAPGEPLRVVVDSPEPLASLGGDFLGRALFLSPDEERRRWLGWTLIGLDEDPGRATIELAGHDRDGREIATAHAVLIEAKVFPEERLSVASKYVEPPPEVERRLARERAKLDALYESRRPVPALARPFVRPVPGGPTSIFGLRRIFNGEPRSPHPGLDLRAAEGTPVRASGPGVVVLAQDLYYSGNTVILDHGGGLFTLYAHLSAIEVEEGKAVEGGGRLGLSGATGRVTGPHLHWGAKIGRRPFDPTALLDETLFADGPAADRPRTPR